MERMTPEESPENKWRRGRHYKGNAWRKGGGLERRQ